MVVITPRYPYVFKINLSVLQHCLSLGFFAPCCLKRLESKIREGNLFGSIPSDREPPGSSLCLCMLCKYDTNAEHNCRCLNFLEAENDRLSPSEVWFGFLRLVDTTLKSCSLSELENTAQKIVRVLTDPFN